MDDSSLQNYQLHKKSAALVIKHSALLISLSKLCKGTYKEKNPLFNWFYGLFLNGKPKTDSSLMDARDTVIEANFWLTTEDCYNQVVLFFLELARGFEKDLNFNQYIRMVLGWRVKHWIDVQLTSAQSILPNFAPTEICYPEEIEPFTMDLQWVLYGSNSPLFIGVTAYERYILYLYFHEDMNLRRIAFSTYQSKNTVNNDLDRILQKCRSNEIREL